MKVWMSGGVALLMLIQVACQSSGGAKPPSEAFTLKAGEQQIVIRSEMQGDWVAGAYAGIVEMNQVQLTSPSTFVAQMNYYGDFSECDGFSKAVGEFLSDGTLFISHSCTDVRLKHGDSGWHGDTSWGFVHKFR